VHVSLLKKVRIAWITLSNNFYLNSQIFCLDILDIYHIDTAYIDAIFALFSVKIVQLITLSDCKK